MTRTVRLIIFFAGAALLGVGIYWYTRHGRPNHAHSKDSVREGEEAIQLKVVRPKKGALERLCVQPGSIHSFESIELFARVSGYLKYQKVDIGDRVKKDQVLAVLDVPDIEARVERNAATLEKAESQVVQMRAHVDVAQADLKAAEAAVVQAESTAKSALAWVHYRKIQLARMESLVKSNAIEDRLYDESKERHDASVESLESSKAAVVTAKAKLVAGKAKIVQAEADVKEAEAEIKVTKAELRRSQVDFGFATIKAPFDGVITYRSMNPKDYVREPKGSDQTPLLTVQRTDLFRVVVLVPDRDVEFISTGKQAEIDIDSLPGRRVTATVSRIATSLDRKTRLMRVELDLPNPTGKIYDGMYGQVTIVLEQGADTFSIPSSCVMSKTEDGKGIVFVARGNRAEKINVQLGLDTGVRVEVRGGLAATDQVILAPDSSLTEQEISPKLVNE